MGEYGIIVSIVGAFLVTVIGGTLVQLIRRVYIEPIADVKPVAAILTVLLSGLSIGIASFLILFGIIGSVTAAAAGTILGGATAYYLRIFNSYGLESATPEQRQKFDSFKAQLEAGGRVSVIYERTLTRALNAVDRFFGDADPAVKTLWPGAFGFTGQAPFWTAPSYDRCLLIALIYPLVMIYAVWGYSGHVGPGEAALDLREAAEGLRRLLVIGALMAFPLGVYISAKAEKLYVKIIAGAFAVAGAGASTFAGASAVTLAVTATATATATAALVGAFTGAVAVALAVTAAVTVAVAVTVTGVGASASALAFLIAIKLVIDLAHRRGWHGPFLSLFTLFMLFICYASAWWLGGAAGWQQSGPPILFLGVLTLVNAPFDWLTLGLTRALLRRGLELGGLAPLLLAIADLIMAAVVIVLLGAAMVVAVDAFNAVTFYAGGTVLIFDLEGTLKGLNDPGRRSEPEYWWIYATLFSTLIPSIINVAIGALSIMRGWGWFHRLVAGKMTPGRAMVLADAIWVVPILAFEVVLSIAIGVVATLGWIWVVLTVLFPIFGGLIPWLRVVEGLI